MEGLAPTMKCLIEIHSAIRNGESVRTGITQYLKASVGQDECASQMRSFLFAWEHGRDWKAVIASVGSSHRRALMDLIASGLQGQSILSHLEELRVDVMSACEDEIRHKLEILPLKMLMPLLLLQFPAFLLLLFGPLLGKLIEELNR